MTTWLIDMDGTLVDSHVVVEDSWTDFAERHGLDAAEVIAFCHGRPGIQTAEHFLGPGGLARQEATAMRAHEEATTDGIVEVPGARAFVAAIPEQDWALVTSANQTLARTRLEVVGINPPPVTVTSEDITHGKPHPEPYLLGAQRMGVEPAQCIVLEDSEAGVRSALAAGCRVVVVGILTTFDGELPRVPDLSGLRPDDLAAATGWRTSRLPARASAPGSGARPARVRPPRAAGRPRCPAAARR